MGQARQEVQVQVLYLYCRLGKQYCRLCTRWSRGGQKRKISWWIVTILKDLPTGIFV